MERTQDVDDLKERIAKIVARAYSLYEHSLAVMDRATRQIDQSSRLLWHRQELLQRSRLHTADAGPLGVAPTSAVACSRGEALLCVDLASLFFARCGGA